LPTDELEKSFKGAIKKLPKGKLRDVLNKDFDKHLNRLKK